VPGPSFDLTPEAAARHEWNVQQFQFQNGPDVPPPPHAFPIPAPGDIPPPNMQAADIPKPKVPGVIVGYTIGHFRYTDGGGQVVEEVALKEGDDVIITTAGGDELKPVWGGFLVADYVRTEMSEYDQSFVYVPLDQLQRLRGMTERATAFQVRLKNYDRDKETIKDELRKVFPTPEVRIATWEQHQGAPATGG
jgi:lipoprotein-releasing system permease protein